MLKFLFKKSFKKSEEHDKSKPSIKNRMIETGTGINSLFKDLLQKSKDEIEIIKIKCQNLLQTNFELGLKHLSEGNLSDARLRFAIMIKFWPKFTESYYHKAYVELLQNKPQKAKQTLDKFFHLQTDNVDPKFFELRQQIEDINKVSPNDQ